MSKRRTATRKRRNAENIRRKETRRLCRANAILFAMTECYEILSTEWGTAVRFSTTLLSSFDYKKLSNQVPVHFSCRSFFLWLLTLLLSFTATWKRKFQSRPTNWTLTPHTCVYCALHSPATTMQNPKGCILESLKEALRRQKVYPKGSLFIQFEAEHKL